MSSTLLFSLFALIILIDLVISAQCDTQSPWCHVDSCKTYHKGEPTLCAYPNKGPQKSCFAKGLDLGGGLTDRDKNNIVNFHNTFRQKVAIGIEDRGSNGPQPAAKPGSMPDLKWDETLATIAQRWADQCNYGHDSCRDVPDYQVGQNIAYKGTTADIETTIDKLDMVQNWYEEVRYFDKNQVPKFSGNTKGANGKDIGHYTQMVWAETTKIGCGLRNYYASGFNRSFLVCNYGPSGNFPGHAVYQTIGSR